MAAPTLNPVFWNLQDEIRVLLVEAINEAVIITGEPEQRSTSLALAASTTIQNLPVGMLALLSLQTAGSTVPKMKVASLDMAIPGWENETGATLKGWFPFGLGKIGVYPKLTGSVTATVGFIPQPITDNRPYDGTEAVDFQSEFIDAFTQYAAGMLRLKEGGAEFSQGIGTLNQAIDVFTSLSSFGYRKNSLKFSKAYGVPAEIGSITKR